MAISTNNLLTAGMSGDMAGQFVFKYYRERDKTVVSKKPNMDGVVPSEKQLKEKSRFAEAIRFAQDIINDPAKKAAYKVEKGQTVYNAAIKDYMRKNK